MTQIKSSIITGKIWHARLQPAKYAFEYPVYFFKFDVDELSQLSKQCRLFSLNRWNIFSLRERDYLRPTQDSLRLKVESVLREQGLVETPATIELITSTRYFGWVFNPVSFFYCRNAEGSLIAVIADVNNTFGEGHAYVLTKFRKLDANRVEALTNKVFHVSPFFDRKGEYRFEFAFFPDKVDVVLDYYEGGELRLASRWVGDCKPFKTQELYSILWHYPFAGWLTVVRIHLQAAVLFFIKKLPIFKRPEPKSEMTIRRKKHAR